MAAEHASMSGMNGHHDHHGGHYQEVAESHLSSQLHDHANTSSVPAPDSFGLQNANVSSTTGQVPNENNKHTDIPKDQVGWHFVEQYYLNLSRSPSKLHLFYNKRSQFVWGVEAEKVEVSVGRTSIADRIKELEFHDCKVRVANVDSQASNNNILIQVIGEMSNKSAPHRKFVQTFILAEQPNGYFVLNDIFRYINDEDDVDAEIDGVQEPVAASSEESAIEPTTAEEPKVLTSSADPTEQQYDANSTVHQRGQKVLEQGHAPDMQHLDEIKANGIHSTESVDSKNDGPIKPEVLRSPVTELSPEPAAPAPTQEVSEKEKPKEAVTTRIASPTASGPAAAPQATTASVAPAKPAAPKTWAKLVATSTSAVPPTLTAAASTPSGSVLSKATPSSEKHAARLDPAHSQPHQSQGSVGWQTAGNDHAKRQTRPQSVSGGVEKETVLAYVRNVTEKVSTDALKAALTAYGELAYFDVSRQKNCAFVEFASASGYSAAIAANPLSVGEEQIYVEERRPRSGAYGGSGYGPTRGGPMGRGGRGNGEGRLGTQGRPAFAKDGGRGGFGAGRGRGGNVTPRGRGGSPVS